MRGQSWFGAPAGRFLPVRLRSAVPSTTPPWSDSIGSDWGDFDTRESAINFKNAFAGSGYASYYDGSITARTAIGSSYAGSDAVWITFGHANPGNITYCEWEGIMFCSSWPCQQHDG